MHQNAPHKKITNKHKHYRFSKMSFRTEFNF